MIAVRPLTRTLLTPVLVFLVSLAGFFANVNAAKIKPLPEPDELSVALPIVVQMLLAGGDKYLAANLGVFRAVFSGVHRLRPETYKALAYIQRDVAILNPYHEDNYYLAAAILPWNGEVESAQFVLSKATEVRLTDDMPPFFLAFNQMHFLGDFVSAARILELAAERSVMNRDMLINLASVWYSKGEDPRLAIGITRQLAERAKNLGLKNHLLERAQRLESRLSLQQAVEKYKEKQGQLPTTFSELLSGGVLDSMPNDPWGRGFSLRADGVVELK